MVKKKDGDVIAFDFLQNLGQPSVVPKEISPFEYKMISILKNSFSLSKIAYYESDCDRNVSIKLQHGFDIAQLNFMEKLLHEESLCDYADKIMLWGRGGLKDTYLVTFEMKDCWYAVIMVLRQPLSLTRNDVLRSVIDSLKMYFDESDIKGISHQFSESVLQNIASGIIVIDKSENIIFLNHAAEMILGYKDGDLNGVSCDTIFREIDRENNWLTFTLKTGCLSSRQKINMVRREGIEVAVGGTTSLLRGDDDEIMGVVGIFRQFEDFKIGEDTRKDLNKVSMLAKFSGSIAHEIRNPLAGISATAQVLATKFAADDRKQKFIRVILEEIDRINRIIKELINFARPSKSCFLKSNVNKIVEGALDLLYKRIQKQGIDVVREYDMDMLDIICDESQIKQAIINIMLNSINAMPEGGLLTVSTEKAGIDNDMIKIVISDTGAGIPEDVINELFTPFTSTKTQGLGLGLTITKSIIKTHNGKIKASNLPEKGAVVTVLIPDKMDQNLDQQTYLSFDETKSN